MQTRNPIRIIRDAADNVRGNARACVMFEPLFAIPNTMYAGYMTLFMLELGMDKSQVGLVTSLGLGVSIFFALISAYITDRLGRRYATLIFDSISWGASQLIWMLAQNFWFFVAAAIINASGRIVTNSWYCLMLEDSEPDTRIHIFNFLQIAGIAAGFFTPVGALLIGKLTIVPAMRVMMLFSNTSMFALFIVRHKMVKETVIGIKKMEEVKNAGAVNVFRSYIPQLARLLRDKMLIVALFIRSLNFIQLTIRNTFLAVLVTERLGFAAGAMAVFHTLNAVTMLLILLFITPALSIVTRHWPISLGVWFHVAATVILLVAPPTRNYALLILSAVLVALGTSVATPRIDALAANAIVNEDRSVVNAILSVILLVISTPFGYIGGLLSEIDARAPFLLTLAIFIACLVLLQAATRMEKKANLSQ